MKQTTIQPFYLKAVVLPRLDTNHGKDASVQMHVGYLKKESAADAEESHGLPWARELGVGGVHV